MKVSITLEDIEKSRLARGWEGYTHYYDCPLAQALQREFDCPVTVEYERVTVGDRTYRTGLSARSFIWVWDSMGEVEPMSVELIEEEPETQDVQER